VELVNSAITDDGHSLLAYTVLAKENSVVIDVDLHLHQTTVIECDRVLMVVVLIV